MADQSDILNVLANRDVPADDRARIGRTFQKLTSAVEAYQRLFSDKSFASNPATNGFEPVAVTRAPIIPMMIALIPPENLPSTYTTTKQIFSPANQPVGLTGVSDRFSADVSTGGSVRSLEIRYIAPTTPDRYQTVYVPISANADPSKLLQPTDVITEGDRQNLSAEELAAKQKAFDEKLAYTRASTDENLERTAREETYVAGLRSRYEDFRDASVKARGRLEDRNFANTGPLRREVRDPYAGLEAVKDAREREVRHSLASLRQQAVAMMELPPLFMYVNPANFDRTYEHIVSDGNKTRSGYLVEIWGEQMIKIEASGKVGAFYVDAPGGQGGGGLAVAARKGSYAYQQFMALYKTYQSNGAIFDDNNRISVLGGVAIYYDGMIYTGSFDSFSISHSESAPYTLEYSFSFTARFEQRLRE